MSRPDPEHPARRLVRARASLAGYRARGVLGTFCLLAALAWLGAGATGCASPFGPGEPPVDTVWRVVRIGGEPVPRLPDNRAPTLLLEGETVRASGFSGCNRMTGSFLLAGDRLSFGPLASTRMACEAAGAAVEMAYMEALGATTRWRRKDGGLELLDAEGHERMRLERTGRVDPRLPE